MKPDVLTEFRELLAPTETSHLDLDLLREEFEKTGLSAVYLGTVSFDVLMRDMMQAFYNAAAEEPLLQEPLKIGVLCQMLERMGLLRTLVEIGHQQLDTQQQILQEQRAGGRRGGSQRAIDLTLTALDYAIQPWYGLSFKGAKVREQAARILGQLEPLYQDEKIFTRLVRVLTEDTNAEVRDAAYGALWRLAAAPAQTGNDMK